MASLRKRVRRRLPAVPDNSRPPKVDKEVLKQLPAELLSQLQSSSYETNLYQEEVIENVKNTEEEEGIATKGRPEISVVEGSFRRIAGIREFAGHPGTYSTRRVEILREPGKSLGFYICQGDGWDRKDGVFVSRVNLGSIVETCGLLAVGDEITKVNDIDVTQMPLEQVAVIMRYVQRLFLTIKVLTSSTRSKSVSYRSDNRAVTIRRNPNVSARNRRARIFPTDNIEAVPYAYTLIGQAAQGEVQNNSENLEYDTVHVYGPETPKSNNKSIETPETPHRKLNNVTIIDCNNINQTVGEPYSGELRLVLHTIHNFMPLTEDSKLVCSILCDDEPTVRLVIDNSRIQDGVAKLDAEYRIQLCQNHKISFSLANNLRSSKKTVPLAYFFPSTHSPRSSHEFALTTGPNGQIKFRLSFAPVLSTIPRYWNQSSIEEETTAPTHPLGSSIPLILKRAVEVISEYGITNPGLYVITTDEEAKREAMEFCNSKSFQQTSLEDLVSRVTVHAFTGVIKDFFANSAQPLFPPELATVLEETLESSSGESLPSSDITKKLSDTALALLDHLKSVCQKSEVCVERISKVFAPILFTPCWHDHESLADEPMLQGDFTRQENLLKQLILYTH